MTSSDLYISVDIEADGPIPGIFSMLSIGMAVAGSYDGETYVRHDPKQATFYAELRPIAAAFDQEALAASGLNRDQLLFDGKDPNDVMQAAHEWVIKQCQAHNPVFVGYGVTFDWMFAQYYFLRYARSGSPFAHSSVLDIKTMYALQARVTMSEAIRTLMPETLTSQQTYSHHALQDAIEQADLFFNILLWKTLP